MRFDIRSISTRSFALLVRAVLLVCAPLVVAGAQNPVPPPAATDTTQRSVGALRPGDVLKIVVFRDKELSGDYPIDARGFVQIPGLGVIKAAGLDPTDVTDRLRLALVERGFARPEISVQPLIRVSVLGEVRSPNIYPVDPGTSLLQLLTVAGGPTDRARLRDTRVIREGRAFRVDMESGLKGSAAGRIVLYSNDVIVVGRRRGLTGENLGYTLSAASLVLAVLNIAFLVRQN
ncbi:MAG TPA: polysaccharide biosynthesis/export family protein [Gemmatimonadaceae bacterium]|nr:polysaccharide biosynthesis/export family protein [Gemmatimonadaceae bacterium]